MTAEFRTYHLPGERDLFAELLGSVRFETTGKGRRGAVLVDPDETGAVPIVRTTTRYATPAQPFRPVHHELVKMIRHIASLSGALNNALIESYDNSYSKMGLHSDQALDLVTGSAIAVYSCYERPGPPSRKLVIESKEPGGAPFEVPLTQHGVAVFSLDTNRRFRHKIVLDPSARTPENRWLGITFRTSGTWIKWRDGQPHFSDGTPLTLAGEEQTREFLQLRSRENHERDFTYPRLTYTLSASDRMPLAV